MVAFADNSIRTSVSTSESAYPRFCDAILSTKYFDDETELVYYGYRHYSPELGRFVNRDPAAERTGLAVYLFNRNEPMGRQEFLGLCSVGNFSWGWVDLGRRPGRFSWHRRSDGTWVRAGGKTSLTDWDICTRVRRRYVLFGCCKLEAGGEAHAEFWWHMYPAPDPYYARNHELDHVSIWETHWNRLVGDLSMFAPSGWMPCRKARCYEQVVQMLERFRWLQAKEQHSLFDFQVTQDQYYQTHASNFATQAQNTWNQLFARRQQCRSM